MDPGILRTRSARVAVPAGLMIVFGVAEVITSFTHRFAGLTTRDSPAATYVGVAVGTCYVAAGALTLTARRRALSAAIVLLVADVLGRIAMVRTRLYPVDTARQVVGIVGGTAVAAGLTAFVTGLQVKASR